MKILVSFLHYLSQMQAVRCSDFFLFWIERRPVIDTFFDFFQLIQL